MKLILAALLLLAQAAMAAPHRPVVMARSGTSTYGQIGHIPFVVLRGNSDERATAFGALCGREVVLFLGETLIPLINRFETDSWDRLAELTVAQFHFQPSCFRRYDECGLPSARPRGVPPRKACGSNRVGTTYSGPNDLSAGDGSAAPASRCGIPCPSSSNRPAYQRLFRFHLGLSQPTPSGAAAPLARAWTPGISGLGCVDRP